MEILNTDILNMIADFDEEIMRNEAEEVAFERAIRNWEMEGAMEDIFGGWITRGSTPVLPTRAVCTNVTTGPSLLTFGRGDAILRAWKTTK